MLDTRAVLAILAGLAMGLALVVHRLGRSNVATWIMAGGFGLATFYSALSIYWAQSNPSPLSPKLWITMASMAAATAVYFGFMGLHGEPLLE